MKINWRTVLRILTLGLIVAADRSAKVRRVAGRIDNYLDLICEIESIAAAEGVKTLPFQRVVDEFKLSETEARDLVIQYRALSRNLIAIVDVPQGDTAAV